MRIFLPILAILAGGCVAFFLTSEGPVNETIAGWSERLSGTAQPQEPVTYRVWLHEIEAEPRRADGSAWDDDGSGPDLSASLYWQETRLLDSGVAKDSLIARWSPKKLKASDLLDGSLDSIDLESVAVVRTLPDTFIELAIYEHDLLTRDGISFFRIPAVALQPGILKIRASTSHGIKHLKLGVASASGDLELSDQEIQFETSEWPDEVSTDHLKVRRLSVAWTLCPTTSKSSVRWGAVCLNHSCSQAPKNDQRAEHTTGAHSCRGILLWGGLRVAATSDPARAWYGAADR
jgi:hypothetical protein